MKLVGAVLVVLALIASVVLLTFRTSLDAPHPREQPAQAPAAGYQPAGALDGTQPVPFKDVPRSARSLRVDGPHNDPGASVRVLYLDARFEPIGLMHEMEPAFHEDDDATVPAGVHAVRLGAVTRCDALVECTRTLGNSVLTLPSAEDLPPALRIELSDRAGLPCIDAWACRTELDSLHRAGPGAVLKLPFHATGWLVEARGCARQRVTGAPGADLRISMHPGTRCALRIVNESGAPMADALVRVPELELHFTTDADGKVQFDALPEDRAGLSLVISGGDDEHHVQPCPAGPGPTTVRVARTPRAEGRVLDATSSPVAGAEIQCRAAEDGALVAVAITDSFGRFRLPAISPGPHLLVARHGTRTAILECTLPATTALELVLTAQQGAAAITCTSNAGLGVGGARTSLSVRGCVVHESVTNADGLVDLPLIAEAELLVEHPLHEDARMRAPGSGKAQVALHARRQLVVTAHAAESGDHLRRLVSTLRTAAGTVIWREREDTWDAVSGSFRFRPPKGYADEDLVLELTADGRNTFTHTWRRGNGSLDSALALAAPLAGRVVSSTSGAGLEGAHVELIEAPGSRTTSGRNGSFSFANPSRAATRIRIEHEGFVDLEVAVPATDSANARDLGTLALHPAGSISFAGPNGALPPLALVRIEHLDTGSVLEREFTRTQGREMRGVSTGRWLASLKAPGTELDGDRRLVDVVAGGTALVTFKSHGNRATVRGRVELPDDRLSVAGLLVRARAPDGTLLAEDACTRDGAFTLDALPLTAFTVKTLLATAHGTFSGTVDLKLPPGESSVTLKLTRK